MQLCRHTGIPSHIWQRPTGQQTLLKQSEVPAEQQTPQSCGQSLQLSPPSHTPLPQTGPQAPQSCGQLLHESLPLQTPSPHTGQGQSDAQLSQLSPNQLSHCPLPQQLPQSCAQPWQLSPLACSH